MFEEFGKEKNYAVNPFLLDIHVARMIEAHRVASNYMADSELLHSGIIKHETFLGKTGIAEEIHAVPVSDGKTPDNLPFSSETKGALPKIWEAVSVLFTENVQDTMLRLFSNFTYKQHLFNCPDDNDEQKVFHTDSFFPCVKFWYFPEKVEDGAFWYAPNSPVLTDKLIKWHADRVEELKQGTAEDWRGQGHKEGSFRFSPQEIIDLGYDVAPVEVDADTLVIANTFGIHRRGDVSQPLHRVSIHGNLRIKNPFKCT